MKVSLDRPPMFADIVSEFPYAARDGVIFTWGDTIYNPSGVKISRELHAHEAIHSERQGDNPTAWWVRYLTSPRFRLEEELPAHRAEYLAYCKRHGSGRDKFLRVVSERLASSLYGKLLTPRNAELAILTGALPT